MTVRRQYSAALDSNLAMTIYVDIVLWEKISQQPIMVLDTKYKSTDQPSEDDIHQITFYARELGVHRALLVYPMAISKPLRMVHGKDILVESLYFDIGTPLEIAGDAFLSALRKRLT